MTPIFLLLNNDKHVKMQLFAKLEKILFSGFRATLNFGEVKGVLTGLTVAMVTNDVMKMATTCLAMIGLYKQ